MSSFYRQILAEFAEILAEIESRRLFRYADKRYLDPLYSPSDLLVGRDEKIKELLELLVDYKIGYVPPVIQVYGKSGTGKTSVVRQVCEKLGVPFCFVNLRQARTIFGCVNLIVEELGLPGLKNASGVGTAIRKIEKQIESLVQGKKLFVLVLDEVDVLFRDRRGDPSDFIFKLLMLQERLREKNCMMTIIAIANGVISDYELDDRVRSRLGSADIFFGAYTKQQLMGILRNRANRAFAFRVEERILEYCAEVASIDHGDARRAVNLLRHGAEIAERSGENHKISKANIDAALDELEKDRVTIILRAAPENLRIVAAALAKRTFTDQAEGIEKWYPTPLIVNEYKKCLQDKAIETFSSRIDPAQIHGKLIDLLEPHGGPVQPVSYRRVSSLLTELCDMGLAVVQTESWGRHGYISKYRLTAPAEIVGRASLPDWWDKAVVNTKRHIKWQEDEDLQKRMAKALGPKISGRLHTVDGYY